MPTSSDETEAVAVAEFAVKPPRSVARLAAVQALYQMEMGGADANRVIAEFIAVRFDQEIEGISYPPVDRSWFALLVRGVVGRQDEIDDLIAATVSQDWSLPRIDATLRAIIRAATFELLCRPDVPLKVIISEYVDVAHAFFSGSEPGFANSVLDRLARAARPEFFTTGDRPKKS